MSSAFGIFSDFFRILTIYLVFVSSLLFWSCPVLPCAQAIPSHGFHQFKSNSLDVLQRHIEDLQVCPSVCCLSVLSHSSHSSNLVFTSCPPRCMSICVLDSCFVSCVNVPQLLTLSKHITYLTNTLHALLVIVLKKVFRGVLFHAKLNQSHLASRWIPLFHGVNIQ